MLVGRPGTAAIAGRHVRWLLAAATATAAVAALAGGARSGGGSAARGAVRCVRPGDIAERPASLDQALRAARSLIPPAYRVRVNPWARAARIVQIVSLQPETPELPGVAAWRRIGARRCGAVVAGSSWLVAADFPKSRVVQPIGIVFIVRTDTGWRLWYRFR